MDIIIAAISNLVLTMYQHLMHFLFYHTITTKTKLKYANIIEQYNGGKVEIEMTLHMVLKMQCTNIAGHIKFVFSF